MIDDCLGIAAQLRKSLSSAATDDAAYQLAKGWLRGPERKGKPEVLCDQLVQRGDDPLEADALCVELKHVTEALSIGPGTYLREVLEDSFSEVLQPVRSLRLLPFGQHGRTRRFPSSLAAVDSQCEGFYGVTVLGGRAGVGKSMLALAAAACTAQTTEKVVYFNLEMDDPQVNDRVWHACGGQLSSIPNFHPVQVEHSVTMEDIVETSSVKMEVLDAHALIVIDSINTLAQSIAKNENIGYFEALNLIVGWCVTARRLSKGDLAFILVSELNQRGEIQGAKPEYSADVVVSLEPADSPGFTDITVRKGRDGGAGQYGPHLVNWKRGRLEPPTN